MYVTDTSDGTPHEAVIVPVDPADYKKIKAGKEFTFNWSQYKGQDVYKLCLKSDETILGLIHIIPHPEDGYQFLEVMLVEVSKLHRGLGRKYDRVGGCLLAFACRQSFVTGCTGYVMLIAKTSKASLFHHRYGFEYIGSMGALGQRMASDPDNTEALIKEFYT